MVILHWKGVLLVAWLFKLDVRAYEFDTRELFSYSSAGGKFCVYTLYLNVKRLVSLLQDTEQTGRTQSFHKDSSFISRDAFLKSQPFPCKWQLQPKQQPLSQRMGCEIQCFHDATKKVNQVNFNFTAKLSNMTQVTQHEPLIDSMWFWGQAQSLKTPVFVDCLSNKS